MIVLRVLTPFTSEWLLFNYEPNYFEMYFLYFIFLKKIAYVRYYLLTFIFFSFKEHNTKINFFEIYDTKIISTT